MAIVKLLPEEAPSNPNPIPETIQELPDSNFTALSPTSRVRELLKYVEGYPWTVDYYGMLRHDGNSVEHFDPLLPNNAQSFYKVNKLVLQVQSPLSSSYDDQTGITAVTGSAIVPLGLKPNMGDLFLANIDTGEDAYFNITSVQRKSYTKETLYEISYQLHIYKNDDHDFGTILDKRINSEFYFNPNTNYFNRDFLIKPSVMEAREKLAEFLRTSKLYYFSTFGREQAGTILIPGHDHKLYDPLLLSFLHRTVNVSDMMNSRVYEHTHFDEYLKQPSIYNLLLTQSLEELPIINKRYFFTNSMNIGNRARFGTIAFSGIDAVIYPIDPSQNQFVGLNEPVTVSENNPVTTKNHYIDPTLITTTVNNDNTYTINMLHPMFQDDYYIVSKSFYDYISSNGSVIDISYIELIIYRFLKKEAIPKEDLYLVVSNYQKWSLLHKLYLLPIMWFIINALN